METGIGTSVLRSLGRRASIGQVVELLESALDVDVRWIDTADTYGAGSAERALGTAFSRSPRLREAATRFRVITKGGYWFPDLPLGLRALNQPAKRAFNVIAGDRRRFDEQGLEKAVTASIRRLAPLKPYAYCLHNPSIEVLEEGSAIRLLERLREQGRFARAGVSVDELDAARALAQLDGIDLVEMPASAWMQLSPSDRERLHAPGKEVVVNQLSGVNRQVAEALRTVTTLSPVPHVVIVGTRDPAHLRQNARDAAGDSD